MYASFNINEEDEQISKIQPYKPIQNNTTYYSLNTGWIRPIGENEVIEEEEFVPLRDTQIEKVQIASRSEIYAHESESQLLNIVTPEKSLQSKAASPVKPDSVEKSLDSVLKQAETVQATQANQGEPVEVIKPAVLPKVNENADIGSLIKEYELGKHLIGRASDKISAQMYTNITSDKHLNNNDHRIVQIFLSLLLTARDNEDRTVSTWTDALEILAEPRLIHSLQESFAELIQDENFASSNTIIFRDAFVEESPYDPKNYIINSIKEYLCEAFWLIDILEELKQNGHIIKSERKQLQINTYEDFVQDSENHQFEEDIPKSQLERNNSDLEVNLILTEFYYRT